MSRKSQRGACLPCLVLAASLHAAEAVSVAIRERAGVNRANEFATFGVPLPRSWQVTNANRLRLDDATGQPLAAQFEILSRWGASPADTHAAAKWLLVAAPVNLSPGATNQLFLSPGAATNALWSAIQFTSAANSILVVDTGAARFELRTNEFNLFEQVQIAGAALLTPLPPERALIHRGIDGTTVVARTTARLPRQYRLQVERTGPYCAVLKGTGSIAEAAGTAALDFTVRYHFYAGSPEARVDFTIENNHEVLVGDDGAPVNVHYQSGTNSVYLGSLELGLQLAESGRPLRFQMERDVDLLAPAATLRLYQDSAGTTNWNVYTGLVGWETNVACAPRLQSFCTQPGFSITGAGLNLTGNQSSGWAVVHREGGAAPGVQVVMRGFWQNFPKAIEARTDGMLVVDFFPNGQQFRHNLRVGEEKTHTLLYRFGRGAPDWPAAEQRARAFQMPLAGQVPPAWVAQTKVLGDVPPADPNRWPLQEHYVRTAFEPNPDFDPAVHDPGFGNRTLREVIDQYNFYGWQDYGDVPLDYEAFGPQQAGQMNLKYWYLYGMAVQWLRSGDERWLDLALPAAWHLADIDYLHIPDEGSHHWVHGAYFGHSNHDEPGNANPNRNSNSPSVDLFFGVPDLLLLFCLTGEQRFREVALEGLHAMLDESQFSDFHHPVPYRERANLIFAYLEGYRHTGDSQWLNALTNVVAPTADLSSKPWLDNPQQYRPAENWHWLSSFQLSQVGWTLGRYLDFCAEYGRTDTLGATNALTGYADFILRHFLVEYTPGRAAAWNAFYFYDPHEDPYLEINDWALATADLLAYAFRYSGRTSYLEAAAKFYATGSIDPVWQDDPPVFLSTKDLVNALNWGFVYLQASLPSEPPPVRMLVQLVASDQTRLEWENLGSPWRYTVEATLDIAAPAWAPLTGADLIPSNSWLDLHPGVPQRFYRLQIGP